MLSECDFLVCTFSSQVKYDSYLLFFAFCLKAKGTFLRQEHSPVKGKWYISYRRLNELSPKNRVYFSVEKKIPDEKV